MTDLGLMSDSELLRIKNKQKASYKNRKTARSNLKKSFHVLMIWDYCWGGFGWSGGCCCWDFWVASFFL